MQFDTGRVETVKRRCWDKKSLSIYSTSVAVMSITVVGAGTPPMLTLTVIGVLALFSRLCWASVLGPIPASDK